MTPTAIDKADVISFLGQTADYQLSSVTYKQTVTSQMLLKSTYSQGPPKATCIYLFSNLFRNAWRKSLHLYLNYINSPVQYHELVQNDLNPLPSPQNIMLVH